MKKIICILAAAALLGNVSIFACRAANKTIEVSTTQEFLNAIGNNRTIVIKEGLDITSTLLESQNSNLRVSYEQIKTTSKKVFFVDEFDGPELHIANVKNLTIVAGEDIIVLMSDPRYADVISFERCTNLTIKGITFGHSEEGYCDNGVLGFTDCSHIVCDRLDMFGCGTEGIEVNNCTDVKFIASKIRDCSYHIMHLRNSSYITFEGCQFFRNREFEQVNIYECNNVLFDNCMFANNTGELFNVSSPVIMRDCVILHDQMFWGDDSYIEYINCVTEEYFNSEQALG